MLAKFEATEYLVIKCQRCDRIRVFGKWHILDDTVRKEMEREKHKVMMTLCLKCGGDI